MKILEVLDTYYPKFDGPVQVVTNYCKSINKSGEAEATAVVPRFPKYEDNQPFTVYRVKSAKGPEGNRSPLPKLDGKLKKWLKHNEVDVIHIHSPFTMCGFFAEYGKKHNIPTIFTFHTKFHEDFDRLLPKPLRKIAMKYIMSNINKVDHVLTVSDGAGECLRDYGYKGKIDVIRNGTDLKYPDNPDELKSLVSEKYGLKGDELVFLSVGRIVENKKLAFALKVMKKLKDDGVKFKYLIVGSGAYENELKKQAEQLQLTEEVIFTGKVMDREFLSAIYLRADLFIFPSTFDTASLAPIEAAAMKLPTIMTAGCSTAEIITDKVNGLLAEADVDAWATAISEANKSGLLEKLRENAYTQVYKTWDDVTVEVLAFYRKCIEEKSEK